MIKNLNKVPPSDDWFTYESIDSEVNKTLDKTKGQVTGNEMEKQNKYYVESINQDPNWLKTNTFFLIN